MNDRWGSVEAAIRYELERLKDEFEPLLKFLREPPPFPLPDRKGIPDAWAFGELAQDEVARALMMDRLKTIKHEIVMAEAALQKNDQPRAIAWLASAIRSMGTARTTRHQAATVEMWRRHRRIIESRTSSGLRSGSVRRDESPAKTRVEDAYRSLRRTPAPDEIVGVIARMAGVSSPTARKHLKALGVTLRQRIRRKRT